MGFSQPQVDFVLKAASTGVSYEHTMLLGRQTFFSVDRRALEHAFSRAGVEVDADDVQRCLGGPRGYVEPFLQFLGAQQIRSLDASSFEGATDVHDLNDPLPESLHAQFSTVVDSGTLEHVFNIAQALRNAMELVALDGHLIVMTPTNNESAHGFYQVSPELLFRALSAENGFEIERFLIREDRGSWYEVIDPAKVGTRAEYRSRRTAYLYVIARRRSIEPIFGQWPQQSDYQAAWTGNQAQNRAPFARRALTAWRPLAKTAWYLRQRLPYPPRFQQRSRHFRKTTLW